jgi:hypothetical protein
VLGYVLHRAQHNTVLSASFDADALYKFGRKIDLDHPNRIDKYGCLFAGCSGSGGDSLSRKGAWPWFSVSGAWGSEATWLCPATGHAL